MRIGCVCDNDAIFLRCELGWIVILSEFLDLLFFHFHVFFSLAESHFHATILDNIVRSHISLLFASFGELSIAFLLSCELLRLSWLFDLFDTWDLIDVLTL